MSGGCCPHAGSTLQLLSLPLPVVVVVDGALMGRRPPLSLVATGAAARDQPFRGCPAGQGQVPVPSPLEDRELGLGVEVLASAELVPVHLLPVRDQHLLQRT